MKKYTKEIKDLSERYLKLTSSFNLNTKKECELKFIYRFRNAYLMLNAYERRNMDIFFLNDIKSIRVSKSTYYRMKNSIASKFYAIFYEAT